MYKFSVIVAVYNIEKYIKRCIDSLIKQTFDDYEIIIVNDGSTDSSLDIVNSYSDKRIKIFNKKNEGLSSARNKGIKEAQGEYCVFIDGDDFVDEDYLEKFAEALHNDKCIDIVMSGFTRVRKQQKYRYEYSGLINKKNFIELYHKMIGPSQCDKERYKMTVWGKCYNRLFIKKNNLLFKSERDFISEDLVFHTDIIKLNPQIKFVNNTGYNYVDNDYLSLTKIFRDDRLEKEIKLRNYLLDKNKNNLDNVHYRIHNAFIERCDKLIENLVAKNNELYISRILHNEFLDESLNFCLKYRNPLKHKLRYFYLSKKNLKLIKLMEKIKKII